MARPKAPRFAQKSQQQEHEIVIVIYDNTNNSEFAFNILYILSILRTTLS